MKQALGVKVDGIGEVAATTTFASAPTPTYGSISDEAERLLPSERRVDLAVGPDLIFSPNLTRLGRELLHRAVLAGLVEGSWNPRTSPSVHSQPLVATKRSRKFIEQRSCATTRSLSRREAFPPPSVYNFAASSPLTCGSPKKDCFEPANGKTAIGAGTPTLMPTIPTCEWVLERRAL